MFFECWLPLWSARTLVIKNSTLEVLCFAQNAAMNREGFYVCPDCNADLVDKLPEKQPKIIETALVMNKAVPKRFWIALACGIGLIGIWVLRTTAFNTYWGLIPFGLGELIGVIFLACLSTLLSYTAYWGLRNIKPFGRVFVYVGLTVVTTLAAITTVYFFLFAYTQRVFWLLYLLGHRYE